MFISLQQKLRRVIISARLSIIPAIAGVILLIASVLPWLNDPLEGHTSAWELPLDMGWQLRSSFVNYGMLCCFCALLAFFIAYVHWHTACKGEYAAYGHVLCMLAGLQCLVPIALFFFQYILADLHSINTLAQHEIQARLIIQCFGYNVPYRIPIDPFNLDVSILQNRFILIFNQFSYGLLLPPIGCWILLDYKHLTHFKIPIRESGYSKKVKHLWLAGSLSLAFIGLCILGRAPLAYVSEHYARTLLLTGNYSQALVWLGRAYALNPALDDSSYYHIERGQALYYLHPGQLNNESRLYLAFTYRSQGTPENAYLEFIPIEREKHKLGWVTDELTLSIEELADVSPKASLTTSPKAIDSTKALSWLKTIIQVDSANIYAHYAMGYISYSLHHYHSSIAEMRRVIQLTTSSEIRSSAYTYLGLSEEGLRNGVSARAYLFEAVALDPNYYNGTAREELSGLN